MFSKLRAARLKQGMTQFDVARQIGMDRSNYCQIEKEGFRSHEMRRRVEDGLGLSDGVLLIEMREIQELPLEQLYTFRIDLTNLIREKESDLMKVQ